MLVEANNNNPTTFTNAHVEENMVLYLCVSSASYAPLFTRLTLSLELQEATQSAQQLC
jgi:hypothetical protein